MERWSERLLATACLASCILGCGGSKDTSKRLIMTEGQHAHYHVHAVDVEHGHMHPSEGVIGGHAHMHQHVK